MKWGVKQLTLMAMLVAIGTITSTLIWFPAGIAKAYPMQHAINVISAVVLGPVGGITVAFLIGLLRNILGVGTILAFPGGMIGAFIAGWLYRKTKKLFWAAFGEVIGTGFLGAIASVPIAYFFLGKSVAVFFFVPSFLVSTISGSILAYLVISLLMKNEMMAKQMMSFQES
ncbi:energy coupling factor transporter S component ThiW [Tepidibacillus decaturensis]|uniref:Energy coupling factor transporter S component ThiW n=1 Tax=Tepidibacillus decaturensis TaxID=1413211 RepID=A0A135L3Y4_9BACI|nr:energy coupling factor transporter S component ThiW [Tepidibacillus decaturensis]KXG43670.1 energy coupling factor transporter S component ThiW [Tepidibacillus decaturensis]